MSKKNTNTNQKGLINVMVVMGVVLIIGIASYFVVNQQTPLSALIPPFIPTPTPTSISTHDAEEIVKRVGEQESSFLIQKINQNNVEGLWYQKLPIERPNDPGSPKTLYLGDDIGQACEGVSVVLASINFSTQKITFTKTVGERPAGGCPICLSGDTLISTPNGDISVKKLKRGMLVWTSDEFGQKQPTTILKVGKTPVSLTHKVVHLILTNGKELLVSPGHPTTDGRTFADLKLGDTVDNSYIENVKLVQYDQEYTYDILPSGDTGFYWANGILVGSTLK